MLQFHLKSFKIAFLACFIATAISPYSPSLCSAQDDSAIKPLISVGNALKKISSILKSGLSKIPPTTAAIGARKGLNQSLSDFAKTFDVSGIPPTLTTIAASPVETIFWRPDVVASIAGGGASPLQCSEFYIGMTDGVSSGLRFCELAEGIGYSLQTLLDAETTLCYMKALPTQRNLRSGAVSIVSGKRRIPDADFTKLFAAGPTPRLVRIHVPVIEQVNPYEEDIFVKVHSNDQNIRSRRLYQAEIYSCQNGESTLNGSTRITVDSTARLSIQTADIKTPITSGSITTLIEGSLKLSGSGLAWDLSKTRRIAINSLQSETENFKSAITITPENLLSIKRRNFFQSTVNEEFSTSLFGGSSALSFRFLAGALKAAFIENGITFPYSGATEFRDSYYAAAPANSLTAKVNQFDLTGDSFFDTDPTIDPDLTASYSCAAKPDVDLNLDGENPTLIDSLTPCIENKLNGMDFCARSTLLNAALQNYTNACAM